MDIISSQTLRRCPVAPIGLAGRRVLAIIIAQMRRQLSAQHPFHQLDLELFHQPVIAEQIFRPLAALQQFVQ